MIEGKGIMKILPLFILFLVGCTVTEGWIVDETVENPGLNLIGIS